MLSDCGKRNELKEGGESPKFEARKLELCLALPETSCAALRKSQVCFPQQSPGSRAVTLLPSFHALCFLSYFCMKATLCTNAHSCTTVAVYNGTTVCTERLSQCSLGCCGVPSPASLCSPSLGGSAGLPGAGFSSVGTGLALAVAGATGARSPSCCTPVLGSPHLHSCLCSPGAADHCLSWGLVLTGHGTK